MSDEKLVVHAYNVMFGDGILVQVPDRGKTRSILIDVGNVPGDTAGNDAALVDALKDIRRKTGGRIDLYVMTHEHLDHVQGLRAARNDVALEFDHVWMTASADPNYKRDIDPEAERKMAELTRTLDAIERTLGALPEDLRGIRAINNRSETDRCVEFIRNLVTEPLYVHRESSLRDAHPFRDLKIRVLAPEKLSSRYYGRGPRLSAADDDGDGPPDEGAAGAPLPEPPEGVYGGAFYDLLDQMKAGMQETLFAIDKAQNNTSVVVELEWRGRVLLFTGDAEKKSWRFMRDNGGLRAVDLFKIPHHSSPDSLPDPGILDTILPIARRTEARALVSVCPCAWPSLPDESVIDTYRGRVDKVYDTRTKAPGRAVKIEFLPKE